jgi:guanylate kinase
MQGTFIVIFGPSGSGKGELIAHIRKTFPEIVFARSDATRAMRPGERDGEVYHFVSNEAFDVKIAENGFLEWAEYSGNRYGTPKSEIAPHLEAGKTVLKEMEVQGVRLVRAALPREQVAVIFISAGEWDALEKRIRARAPITEEELVKRRERYEDELSYRGEADYEIENLEGKLSEAKQRIEELVRSIISGK